MSGNGKNMVFAGDKVGAEAVYVVVKQVDFYDQRAEHAWNKVVCCHYAQPNII